MIWYSTLECAVAGETLLLTGNTRDASNKGAVVLAEDLVADLRDRSFPDGRVVLTTSTSDVLRQVLPEWDEPALRFAWSTFVSSKSVVEALNQVLDDRLGHRLTASPEVPAPLWNVGVRSIVTINGVGDARLVPDGDDWYRVHASLLAEARIGGYVWAWGDPNSDLGDFDMWDSSGGLIDYFASPTVRSVDVVVACRFRPLVEMSDLDSEPFS